MTKPKHLKKMPASKPDPSPMKRDQSREPYSKSAVRQAARKAAALQAKRQKALWVGGGVLAILAVLIVVLILTSQQSFPAEVSVAEAFEKREAGAFMLDVREQNEWDELHMDGATLIPLGQLGDRLNELPKDQEIVVVCRTGNRSAQARDLLKQNGFESVTSMAGGMVDWQAANYPIVTGP
jgi:rhodanese-related sulfurtransferase